MRVCLVEIKAKSGFYPLPLFFIICLFPCVHAVIDVSGNSPHRIDESLTFAYSEMLSEVEHCSDEAVLFPMIGFHAVSNFILQLCTRPRCNRSALFFFPLLHDTLDFRFGGYGLPEDFFQPLEHGFPIGKVFAIILIFESIYLDAEFVGEYKLLYSQQCWWYL